MSSLLVYKPANLFIIVSKYFFPIPLLKISSVTVSADVFLYQPEFPWLNSSNIYLLTLLNADTFSFASHLSPAILHSGLNSFPLFQFRFIIFQVCFGFFYFFIFLLLCFCPCLKLFQRLQYRFFQFSFFTLCRLFVLFPVRFY